MGVDVGMVRPFGVLKAGRASPGDEMDRALVIDRDRFGERLGHLRAEAPAAGLRIEEMNHLAHRPAPALARGEAADGEQLALAFEAIGVVNRQGQARLLAPRGLSRRPGEDPVGDVELLRRHVRRQPAGHVDPPAHHGRIDFLHPDRKVRRAAPAGGRRGLARTRRGRQQGRGGERQRGE
ncbi:hypothetical protein [Marinicauda algicola]|uniref:hypothetical protein n=1 Tax=Marinicauda algicola TaxID=2029849 RepID=UPI0019D2CBB0